ncbi:hypothetical protein M0R45_027320 [Rubus argutus]|uniref:K-box domain-containing protein n=1 Tax=Rubus argutus TaxID=59490 RepID=A0AAW1X0P4_RUBAR
MGVCPNHLDPRFGFNTLDLEDVIARYKSQAENLKKLDPQSLELQHDRIKIGKEFADKSHELRQLNGEDLEGLNIDELQKLERQIERGLSRVLQAKEEKIMNEILALEEKGAKLLEANYQLRRTIGMLSNPYGSRAAVALESDISTVEEGLSSESATNVSSVYATGCSADDSSSSDTLSLKLG